MSGSRLLKLNLSLLLALSGSVYFFTATDRALLDDGDALYAHVAEQMLERHDWVTPYADGVRFLDKPPLMYWLMATAYALLGVSEFSARLPSVLAVLGTACLLYLIANRAAGQFSGLTAGAAGAFCAGTFLFTRMVFPDMLFVFLLSLSLYGFLGWYSGPRERLWPTMLFYAAVAGAVLTKGIVGVLFPAGIVLLFMLWVKDWRSLKSFHLLRGTLFFLVLAAPWHLLAAWRNPGFLWYFFVNEHLFRFLGRRQPADYDSVSLFLFWSLLLVWLFPWSAFFPAIGQLFRALRNGSDPVRTLVTLSVSWIIVVLAFFSFSSRIEHYSLPLVPPLALLLGIALCPENVYGVPDDVRRQRWVGHGFTFLGILGGFLALLVTGACLWFSDWPSGREISAIAARNLHSYRHYFAPLAELPPQTLARLEAPLVGTAVAFGLGLLSASWLNRRARRMAAILVLSVTMMSFCFFAWQSLGVCEQQLSSKEFGNVVSRLYQPGDWVIAVSDFEAANSVNFYSPAPLLVYRGTAALLDWGLRYPDAPKRILDRHDLESRWNGSQRTFLLVSDDQLSALGLNHCYRVFQSAGRTLVCNQPVPDIQTEPAGSD